jgi:hypothetical protein
MIFLLVTNFHARSQGGIVSAPVLELLTESQTAVLESQTVQFITSITEEIHNLMGILQGVQNTIDAVKNVKDTLQKIYDYNKRNYDKLKHVVDGIKDFKAQGLSYFAERLIGRSLNPADYMLNIDNKEYNKFKKSISYDPGSDITSRARYSYDYLAKLTPSMAIMDLVNWKVAWGQKKMEDEIAAMESIRKTDSLAVVAMNRALDTSLVMGDGERLQLLLQAQQLLAANDANRKHELESIEEVLNRKVIDAAVMEKKRNHANSIYAYQNVVTKRWRTNKGFSLAAFAKARGKKVQPVIIDTGVQFQR